MKILLSICLLITWVSSQSFVVIGDLHMNGEELRTKSLRYMVNEINRITERENLQFVMIVGDITRKGKLEQFNIAKTELDRLKIPYIPCLGNHDINFANRNLFESTFADTLMENTVDHPLRKRIKGEEGWNYQNFHKRFGEYFKFIFLDYVTENITGSANQETLDYLRQRLTMESRYDTTRGIFLVHHHPLASPVLFIGEETTSFSSEDKEMIESLLHEFSDEVPLKGILTGHFHVEYSSYPLGSIPKLKQWVFPALSMDMVMFVGRIDKENGDLTFERFSRDYTIEQVFYFFLFEIGFYFVFFFFLSNDFRSTPTFDNEESYSTSAKYVIWFFVTVIMDLYHSFTNFTLHDYVGHVPSSEEDEMIFTTTFWLFLFGFAVACFSLLFVGGLFIDFKLHKQVLVKINLRIFGTLFCYIILVTCFKNDNLTFLSRFRKEREITNFGSSRLSYNPMFRLISLINLHIHSKVWVFIINFIKKRIIDPKIFEVEEEKEDKKKKKNKRKKKKKRNRRGKNTKLVSGEEEPNLKISGKDIRRRMEKNGFWYNLATCISMITSLSTTYFFHTYWVMCCSNRRLTRIMTAFVVVWIGAYFLPLQ